MFSKNIPEAISNICKKKYRQVVNRQQNIIGCKEAIIDYMFRPFFIRPSSGLAWHSKEELVQLCEV